MTIYVSNALETFTARRRRVADCWAAELDAAAYRAMRR